MLKRNAVVREGGMSDLGGGDVLRSRATFADLDPVDARMMVKTRIGQPDFVLLDVRTPGEHELMHIDGDINVDYHSPDFYRELLRLPRDRTYLVYCSTGARSGRTVELMRELDFNSAQNLAGGINAWLECGFKVEEGDFL
jgi:rhodanese-related sulfurtransferase